ncbi:MAG: nitrogen fixation protein NifM [Gammaproteobacteria bacterium]
MNDPERLIDIEPYNLLRAAQALFKKSPKELTPEEQAVAQKQARREYDIESRVLKSPEAAGVIITEEALGNALQQIRQNFDGEENFIAALEQNGLNQQSLRSALLRQCKVENVLESIASKASTVSDVEIDIYYHMHPEKFRRPEQRSARHILLTINDQYPENRRENALKRISEIAEKLKHKPNKFAELAMKNSECPTALQGGELGTFTRGQLYPEIDEALFNLKEGQISRIVETEVGFHIVQCEKIHHAESMSLKKARPKIRQLMQERSRRNCQRAWLASLSASPSCIT